MRIFLRLQGNSVVVMTMSLFFSITGNLLAETTATFDFPKIGQTVRAKGSERFQAGGKGVNASRAARALGFETYAAIFPAGSDGKKCVQYLKNIAKIGVIEREISGNTRTGLVCVDSASGVETTFLGADVPVSESAFAQILEDICLYAKRGDILAFCGSCPNWKSAYADLLADLSAAKGFYLCADTYGEPLKDFIKKPLSLLKINRVELFKLFNLQDTGGELSFADAFERLSGKCAAEYLAVTDGGSAAKFRKKGEKTFFVSPPKIEREVSATGCGDVALAGLSCGLFGRGFDFSKAAQKALAIASACAATGELLPPDTSILTKIFNQ